MDPPPGRGEFDTLELVINVGKSVLFYSTINILCKIVTCDSGDGKGCDELQG